MSYCDAGVNPTHNRRIEDSVNANFNALSSAIAETRIKARIEAEARIEEKKNAVLEDGPPQRKKKR